MWAATAFVSTSAMFNRPASIELSPDASNTNIEFMMSDTGNNAVRKLSVDEQGNWAVQTMTGGHSAGYRDGDPISAARAPFLLIFAALDCWCRSLEVRSKIRTNEHNFHSAARTARPASGCTR